MPLVLGDRATPVVGIDKFLFLQLKPLNRGRVRRLLERAGVPIGFSIDQAVEEIITRFRALGIPLTAAYVVIYLSILANDRGFSPINTSTVIQNFVEDVLEKYKPEYQFRVAFDYRSQVSYLSDIAERMCRGNTFDIEYATLYKWTQQHFEFIGIEQDYQNVIHFFVLNKVFAVAANVVYFKYRIFLSFFIASQIHYSAEFRAWILSNNTYMNYVNELDLYCGMNRNDVATLDFLGSEFERHANRLAELVAPLAWVDRLEHLNLPPVDKGEYDFAGRMTQQLTSPNLSGEARDEMLEGGDSAHGVKPAVTRPEVQGVLALWVLSLRAYTVALKNLEGIQATKKEEHLQAILEGWATLLRDGPR
jgi:hypothetical protein